MLVLTRRYGQSIRIGSNIIVTVLGRARSGEIKLGITAPVDVNVARISEPEGGDDDQVES